MSDVAFSPPPPQAQTQPPPAATEVPVNPNPPSTPTPIGSQAPDKPPGELSSRRESIQRAFDKARKDNPPKPREAKMGDNQPPEAMERERPKLDLKKRPDDQPKGEPPNRGEHGHFAPRQPAAQQTGQSAQQTGQPAQQALKHAQLPEGAPYRDPLPRMDERAKADWAATPESVRGNIYRAQAEFQKAYQHYRHDNEVMNTIRPFHEMARQQGTTLERALGNYVQMENKLRQDPIGGLDLIVHNLNLRADDGTRLTFRDLAWHYLNQTPEQQDLIKHSNATQAQQHQIGQLSNMVRSLANGIQQMQYQQQFAQTRGQLDRYAESHPRFDELGDIIEREIKLGFSLDEAYSRAELLRPATHAAQTRTASAQTRPTARSISGAPAGPSNGTGQPRKPVGRREAILGAIKRANGSL